MRAALLCLCLAACASGPRAEPAAVATRVELPPIPPITGLDSQRAPPPGSLGRDAALADRFTAEGQEASYDFESRQGELSLFGLMTWGYARGWHACVRISILDDQGRSLHEEVRAGGAAWFAFMPFVAPRAGTYRYRMQLEEGYFRFRLARHSSCRARLPGAIEDLGTRTRVDGYLASGADEACYRVRLAAGEHLALKLLHAEEDGRKERRTSTPLRLRTGTQAGFLHPVLELAVELDGVDLGIRGAYALCRAGRAGECLIRVRAAQAGDGARFELVLERDPRLVEVTGTVVDREDRPLAGIELQFLRGSDRDFVGHVLSGDAGGYRIALPPGPYRVRLLRACESSPHVVRCTAFRERVLDLMWIDEPLSLEDEIEAEAASSPGPAPGLSRASAPR